MHGSCQVLSHSLKGFSDKGLGENRFIEGKPAMRAEVVDFAPLTVWILASSPLSIWKV